MKLRLAQRGIMFFIIMIVISLSSPLAVFADDDDLQVVKLQLRWDNQFQFAGYYAADWQGYYAEEGIKVEIIPAIKSDQTVLSSTKEVSEGRADFGIGSSDILVANDNGADLRIVAVIMQRSAARYYLKQETKFTDLSDLTELKVARHVNDLIDIELQAMLIQEGINPNLVEAYLLQPGLDDFISDKVQVLPGYKLGVPYVANQKGIPIKEINPQDYGVDFYGDSLFVSGSIAEQDPELVDKFKRASLKGWEYAFNHSEEIAKKISQDLINNAQNSDLLNFNRYQAQVMKELAEYPIVDVGHINPYRWQKMIDFLKSDGLIKNEVDINKLIFDPVKLNIEKEKQRNDLLIKIGLGAVGLLILMGLWTLLLKRTVTRKTEEIIRAKSNLVAAENKYRLITDNTSDVISVYNLSKKQFTYVSPSVFALRGFTAEEALNEKLEAAITPDFFEVAKDAMAKNVDDFLNNPKTKNSYMNILQLPCKNGDTVWVEISTKFQYNAEGELEAVNISRNIEERKKTENNLLQSEQRYKFLFEYAGAGVGFFSTDGIILSFNKMAAQNMGRDAVELEGKSLYELFPKVVADMYMERITKASKIDSPEEYIDYVSLEPGDKWFSSTLKRIASPKGEVIGVQIISQDITERMEVEKELKASEERYQLMFQKSISAYALHEIICNSKGEPIDYRFLAVNPAFEQMTGLKSEDIKNRTVLEVIPTTEDFWIQTYGKVALTGEPTNFEHYSIGLDKHFAVSAYRPAPNQFACVFFDITDRKKAEEIMINLSYYDQLTGLYNRRFYEEELKRLDKARNLPITLIMSDVNGLKLTNDAFGHQAGDVLLKTIAEILKTECRSDEIISRIGGDEFVILLPNTDSEDAKILIQRIRNAVNSRSTNNELLSLSIGHAVKDNIFKQFDEVFKEAEDDMYRHKLTESSSFRSKSIDIIMNSLYEKSSREMHHSKRVSYLCEQIASHLDFNEEEIKECEVAGLVHDIGKIGVSNIILDKDGKLTNAEWAEMKKHSEMGYRILSSVVEFSEIADFVLSHQERWDGKGYPQALKEEQIPIQSRIIAIADSFDAMTVERPYRKAMSEFEAVQEIKKCAGTQFDPNIAKIFVEQVLGDAW